MRAIAFVIFTVVAAFGFPSLAATVDGVQGQVEINRGAGFTPVVAGTDAKVGDILMANPGGSARVVYPDGCAVEIRPGGVVSIGAQSPCHARYSVGECQNSDPKDLRPCEAPFVHSLLPFAIGTAIAGGAFLISSENDDNGRPKPRSP
jgi:hypothetical protein